MSAAFRSPSIASRARTFSPDQLKVVQEILTLSVFYFGDRLHWNRAVAFGCLVAGALCMFQRF